MAATRHQDTLEDILSDEPYRFGFFQAVRLMARLLPQLSEVGRDALPDKEFVRFRANPTLEFPASQLHAIKPAQGQPSSLIVNFMGLFGPQGALPQHYTEMVIQRLQQKDGALRDFLDLFNHRLISLFYRCWEKYQVVLAYERGMELLKQAASQGRPQYRAAVVTRLPLVDPLSQLPLDVAGLGPAVLRYRTRITDELTPRTELPDSCLRFFAGRLAQQHRCANGLEAMVSDYFRLAARIEPLCGRWLQLEPGDQTSFVRLGNNELGTTAIAGQRVWDVQSLFRLRLGPLTYSRFMDLLPNGAAHVALCQMARLYAGAEFDCALDLKLLAREVPACQMSSDAGGGGALLGWNTWLLSEPPRQDASVILLCRAS